jgi:sugar phosphate isomerase/epimerase/GNAT superfamily N-acetyltransferase
LKLIRIHKDDKQLLEKFLSTAGKSLERFRYFSKRGFDALDQHKVTLMIVDNNGSPVAYGHLDSEDGTIWLGNCVVENETGKGLGGKIMQGLLNFARDNKIEKIKLSVDTVNASARKLYESHGFRETEKKESFSFYEWDLKSNPEIYISTLAFIGKSAEEIISIAKENNFGIEFSSGMPFRADMENVFLNAPVKKYAHNYFPAPEKPFVLNLASLDDEIRTTSIAHCIRGMELSEKVGARFFSAHAGFCIDPSPEELGNPLSRKTIANKQDNWNHFVQSIKTILEKTSSLNLRFLAENNVLAKMNVYTDGTNPLFCCDAAEMENIVSDINDPRFGILLDTAHLKVSAQTLGFDKKEAVVQLKNSIGCIHHSDNEGEFDNNQSLQENYWFLENMKDFYHVPHVVEVKKLSVDEVKAQIQILNSAL